MVQSSLTVQNILRKGWQLYYQNWRLFILPLGIMLCPYVILFVLQYLRTNFIPILILLLLTLIIFLDFWLTIFFIQLINNLYQQKRFEINTLYESAFKKIPTYLVVAILYNLMVFAGLFLFIVPGVILLVWFYFAIYIKILEEKEQSVFATFKASQQLVQGRWLDTFFRLLIPSLLIFCLALILIVLICYALKNTLYPMLEIKILANYLTTLFSIILSPLFTAFIVILYNDLKITKLN